MPPNSQNHLDDLAKRFAATAPTPKAPDEQGKEFDGATESTSFESRQASRRGIMIFLAVLVAAAVVGLLLMRR